MNLYGWSSSVDMSSLASQLSRVGGVAGQDGTVGCVPGPLGALGRVVEQRGRTHTGSVVLKVIFMKP